MIFFYQKSEKNRVIHLPINNYNSIIYKNIVEGEQPTFEHIYLLPPNGFNNHHKYMQENQPDAQLFRVPEEVIVENTTLPCMIGNATNTNLFRTDLDAIEAIESIYKDKKEKLSIVLYSENRYSLGDSLVQASVYKDLYDQLVSRGVECQFISYRIASTMDSEFLYSMAFPELKFRYLPSTVAEFFYADFILSEKHYAGNTEKDIHDFFAEQMCFTLSDSFDVSSTIETDLNIKKRAQSLYKNRFDNKLPTVVFNKESNTTLRNMPDHVAKSLIEKLLESGKMNIVSFDRQSYLDIQHERFQIYSEYTYKLKDYFSFVDASDGVISVDSGAVHLAARLNKPVFSFYTSMLPELREAHYKNTESVSLIIDEHFGKHGENISQEEQELIWSELDIEKTAKKIIKKFKKGLF